MYISFMKNMSCSLNHQSKCSTLNSEPFGKKQSKKKKKNITQRCSVTIATSIWEKSKV